MPKIPKPDGHRTPTFTKAQHWKLRAKKLGVNQDGSPKPKEVVPFAATTITGMEKLGKYSGADWRIVLSCRHQMIVTLDELQAQSLFQGKSVSCPECKLERSL